MILKNFRAPEARFCFSSEQMEEFLSKARRKYSYDVCGPLGVKETDLQSLISNLDSAKNTPGVLKLGGRGSLQNQPSIRLCVVTV